MDFLTSEGGIIEVETQLNRQDKDKFIDTKHSTMRHQNRIQ